MSLDATSLVRFVVNEFLSVVTETVHSNNHLLTLSPCQMFGTTIIVCSLYNSISYKKEKGKETKLGHVFPVGFKTQIQSKTTYSTMI